MKPRLCLPFLFAVPLLAQKPPDADAFVPSDYRCECLVDFQALDQHEMLEGLRRSALGMVFGMFEQQLGFALTDLKRLRAYPEMPTDADETRHGGIAIFEGNHNVGLPGMQQLDGYKEEKLGSTPMLVEQSPWNEDPDIYASPRDGLMITGSTHLVRPVLEGKSKLAVPPADFLSLTSGRGSLAHFVAAMSTKMLKDLPFLTPEMWSAEDPPKYLMLRLRLEPGTDGPDDDVVFEAVVRCTGKQGPEVIAKTAREALQAAEQHPRLGALKHLWKKIELKTDGIDLVAHMSLGRPRDAAGSLGLMLAPLLLFGTTTTAVPAQAVQVVPAEVVVEEHPVEEHPVGEPAPKKGGAEEPKEKPKGGGNGG